MKKNLQVFISYCTVDKPKKDALKVHLIALQEQYAKEDVHLEICEMETHCAGEWDGWMTRAVKASDVVIFILEDSLFTGDKAAKRNLEELRTARSENKGIVPLILTERELPDEYQAHLGRISQVWYTYENGNEEEAYKQTAHKTKLLLDGIIKGEKVEQGDSVRILSGVAGKNEKFVGRESEMQWLREKLAETNVVILKGEGGIGKTSLAENFFHQNPDLYDRAYIVTAASGIRQGICSVNFETSRHIKDEEQRYAENYRLMSNLSSKTIIILDNCDEEINTDELSQIVDKMACRFMVTSRVGNDDFSSITLDIGKMQDTDLLALTYKHYPNIVKENGGNKTEVETLLRQFFREVDGHTMTVEMASAIMRDGDIPARDIHAKILQCNEKCKTRHDKEKKASESEHLTVLYDFATVSEIQENILSAVCLIEPSVGIERKALKELLGLEDNNDINELVSKTFLRMHERTISMHPLFSDVFYTLKKVAEKKLRNATIIAYLVRVKVDEADLKGNERKALLLGYLVEKRKDAFSTELWGNFLVRVYHSLAWSLRVIVEYDKALSYYLKAIEILEKVYEENPNQHSLAVNYNNVGGVYGDLGEYKQSLKYQLKALKIYKKIYAKNPNHPDLATSYNNVGGVYGALGEHKKELKYFLKALKRFKKIYAKDPNHPDLAMSYNNVGCTYGSLGNYKKALEYELKALVMREKLYADNPNHPDLAASYNSVGSTYGDLGDHEKALEYKLKALDIYEKLYANYPNHPDLATSYNNVGVTYGELGDHKKALEYQLKALDLYEKVYADYPNHPALANSYFNVAYAYESLKDYEKALVYYEKARVAFVKPEDIELADEKIAEMKKLLRRED